LKKETLISTNVHNKTLLLTQWPICGIIPRRLYFSPLEFDLLLLSSTKKQTIGQLEQKSKYFSSVVEITVLKNALNGSDI